jgi:hypothetical protein
MDKEIKYSTLIKFSGEHKEYSFWAEILLSIHAGGGYKSILTAAEQVPSIAELTIPKVLIYNKLVKIRKLINKANGNLHSVCLDKISFLAIKTPKQENYLMAAHVWPGLTSKKCINLLQQHANIN